MIQSGFLSEEDRKALTALARDGSSRCRVSRRANALTLAKRLKAMGNPKYQNDGDPRTSGPGFGVTLHEDVLQLPKRWAAPRLIFVNSMSDLFHPAVPEEYIARVFDVMSETPRHTFQILTKRSKRLTEMSGMLPWPSNVWMGVSV